jgi:HEAT repeat protein
MFKMRTKAIPVVAGWALSLSLTAQPAPKVADMEPVLARVAAWDPSQARDPLYEFTNFLRVAMASGGELPKIEARLLRMLAPGAQTSPGGKDFICRQISIIGTEASVPMMARLLNDPSLAEIARYTLERIPGPSAGAALRSALPKASEKSRVGIINALAARRDIQAAPALKTLLNSADAAVSEAALAALAKIGGAPSLAILKEAAAKAEGARREPVLRAYLQCADAVAAGGDKAAARNVYQQLIAPNEPGLIRIAAFHGLVAVDGRAAIPSLAKELNSPNSDLQAAAIRLLNRMPGADVTAIFTKQYAGLPPFGQIRVLAALGQRGDAAVIRPIATQALKSGVLQVRTAALMAIGKVGDGSSVQILAEMAANTQGDEQAAARESLGMIRGSGVDTAIEAAITSSIGNVQLELIRAAGERASPQLADVLMKIAQGQDRKASQAAIRALRNAAGPEQAPVLLNAALRIPNANERREAALTLASVMKRTPKPVIGPVLSAYQSAGDKQTKVTLIDVMGQVSASEALPILRVGIKDPDAEIARASILALTAWANSDPFPDLLEAARNDSNPARQILALRGCIRLIGAPSERSRADSVALIKQIWPLAKQQAEKRAILALLPLYPTPDSLRMADAAVADQSVTPEAKAAADSIRAFGVE